MVEFSWETFNDTTVKAFKYNNSKQESLLAENSQGDDSVSDAPSPRAESEGKPSFQFFNSMAIGLVPRLADASAESNVVDPPKMSIASNGS